ncbi:hypothetical protein A3D01_01750 [Candidatus Woesebacteria bacterium RIFCSPHIGHO2_02_FULL_39_13]|uniref:Uncharacterized protein n=1 Tax=Candidatus Woesebacteria bacterium RIFCSPHIGHO2_02_FULL_39_13 TaxID=1802505 RepID=A0A1F7YZC1_9BACT|nr:MAG: hypothetical protein A3D01_01750 [Candidatus Woesebacteria bacterium RIFCSPHIGHO2_02_FULL_39_13]
MKKIKKFIRKERKQVLKTVFVTLLVTSWLLAGWPPLLEFRVKNREFRIPSEIEEAKAAFGTPTARGSAVENSNDNSIVVTSLSGNIVVGRIAIVQCVSDNNDTANGATTFHSLADTDTHTWTRVYEETDSDGAADDGSTTSLWWTKVVTQIDTTDSITCTLGANKTDKTLAVFEVTVAAGFTVATEVGTPGHADSGTSLDGSISVTSRDYLFVGSFGAEGEDESKTKDADYTLIYSLVSTTSGLPAANVQSHLQYRIVTAASDTVSITTTDFTNGTHTLAGFYEVALSPTYTQNHYRWYVNPSSSENVTDPWSANAGIDLAEHTSLTPIPFANDPPGSTQQVRLRVNITVNTNTITANTKYFKLQFRTGTDSDCSTGSWTDVGAAAGAEAWVYTSETGVADDTTLTVAKLTGTDRLETYSRVKPANTPTATSAIGEDIEFDFHIVGGTAFADATRYLFRAVETTSDGSGTTALNTYTNCAIMNTEPGTANLMRHGNFFSGGSERGFYWAD